MRLCRAKSGRGRAAPLKHLQQLAMRIRVAAPAARIALGELHQRPGRGPEHFPVVLLRIREGFRQFQRITVSRIPVFTQAAEHPADKTAAQIRGVARFRKQQQARVARHKFRSYCGEGFRR